MKIFWVCALILGASAGINRQDEQNEIVDNRRQEMIETNRIPKVPVEDQNEAQGEVRIDLRCDECQLFVRELDSMLRNPEYVNALKSFLKQYGCKAMPETLREYCESTVDDIQIMLDYLEPMLQNAKQACIDFGMCQGNRLRMAKSSFKMFKAFLEKMRHSGRSNDLACDECKFAVSELHSIIQSKDFQAEFRSTIETLCDYCPSKDKCNSFIDEFLPTFFKEMESLTADTQGFCSELGFCTGGMHVVSMKLQKAYDHVTKLITLDGTVPNTRLKQFYVTISRLHGQKGINMGCLTCQFAINSLKQLLIGSKSFLDKMVQGVENMVCNRLPGDIKDQCIDFLNLYGSSALIMVIQEEIDADKICSSMRTCDSTDAKLIGENEGARSELECEACTGIVEYVKYELESKEFQDAVVAALKQMCSTIFHGEGKEQQCKNLIDEFWPEILAELKIYLKPKEVCTEIGMCEGTA